jgi:CO/xanthine dehydrogenase Mo-binding subunit
MTTTIAHPRAPGVLGTNEIRVEGRDKVSGRMQYTADVKRPNMLWAAFTTSPYAHAKIVAIDTAAAKAVAGVRAVLTGADIGPHRFGRNLADWPVLACEKVLLIGDRVAAVAAETREAAEEAARLVDVTYEELPALLDPLAALEPDAPVLHPDRASYFHAAYAGKEPMPLPHLNLQGWNRVDRGERDLEAIFASAHRVFEHRFVTPRQHAGYIEPRSTLVWIDDDGTIHMQSPNKMPFPLRGQIARCLGIPKEKIVVEPSAIGGDFGGKGTTVDELPCYFLAKATGRPVRYVEPYTEELGYAPTRHGAHITLKSAVDRDGKLLAHASEVVYDGGAYGGGKPGPRVLPGSGYSTVPYNVPNSRIESRAVYTNHVPAAHVRAPNDLQLFFAWEQHVEMIAEALGIDSIELRLRNLIRGTEPSMTNDVMNHPAGVAVLERLRRERKRTPLPPGRGRGISLVCRHTGGGKTSINISVTADGRIAILTGVTEQGGGQLTVAQRVAAGALGVDPARIAVRRGATNEALEDPGTGGGRVTHVVGRAAKDAAEQLRAQLEERSGMSLRDDRFVDPATGKSEAFADVAARICASGPLEAVATYDGTHAGDPSHPGDFTFTAYEVEVEVDRETGSVTVHDVLLVTDIGEIINPIAHQGQIDGGFIAGLGSALMEEIEIDESGKVTTLSLGEYKLPTMKDIPPFRTVFIRESDGEGPWGTKMAGELSNTGVAPAIVNAVYDAAGIRLNRFPITSERVFEALQHA